jgi:hypothetical protein
MDPESVLRKIRGKPKIIVEKKTVDPGDTYLHGTQIDTPE